MKAWALGAVLLVGIQLPVRADDKDGFAFPPDKGGQLLGTLLTPGDNLRLITVRSGRKVFPPLRSLELAETPLPPSQAPAISLPPPSRPAPLKPAHAAEELPLTTVRGQPLAPQSLTLAAGLLTRTPSAPPDQPPRVPILAKQVADRVSLDDPTRDASLEAVLTAVPPSRPGPAPFLRTGSTDPFENRETVKVRTPTPEQTLPVTAAPRPPRP